MLEEHGCDPQTSVLSLASGFLWRLIPSKPFIWSQMIFPPASFSSLLWESRNLSFAKLPSSVASWMVLIYSLRKTLSHLWLVIGMASSFTNQASSLSEPVHVLAVGWFYGHCLGNQCDTPNKIAFSGLGMVRSFFKVCSSSNGHQLQVSSHLLGSLRELLTSRHWDPFLEMVQDIQFSISRAHGGEQWCR